MNSTAPREWVASPTGLKDVNWWFTIGCFGIAVMLLAAAVASWSLVSFAFFFAGYLLLGVLARGTFRAWKGDVLRLSVEDSQLSWGWSKQPQESVALSKVAHINVSWGNEESWPSIEIITRSGDYLQIPKAFTAIHVTEIVGELKRRGVEVREGGSDSVATAAGRS